MREDWNEKELKRIAKGSGVKQTVADVSYAQFLRYHEPTKIIVRWFARGGVPSLCPEQGQFTNHRDCMRQGMAT